MEIMNNTLMFFEPQYLGYIWLIIAIIFLFAEIGTPGLFFFIAFAVGSFFAAVVAFLEYSLVTQCIVSLLTTGVAFFILRHYFSVKSHERVGTNVDALVGQKGVVAQVIEPTKFGRVKVKGETWQAESERDVVLQKGTVVKVVRVVGNRLIVTSIN